MFEIKELTLTSIDRQNYTYTFSPGVNYFQGRNSSGKTVFYNTLDYMFGSGQSIENLPWYKDSIEYITLVFTKDSISYTLRRTLDSRINYFKYENEEWTTSIALDEYVTKLNAVFQNDIQALEDLRSFTEENMTFRTFTMFNFLDERSLGHLNNFISKSRETKYYVKLVSLLNYIFNPNRALIEQKKTELNKLNENIAFLEAAENKYSFIRSKINVHLRRLNIDEEYNGKNHDIIVEELKKVKELTDVTNKQKPNKEVSDLLSIYNNLDEQIKIYDKQIKDSKDLKREQENRQLLVKELSNMVTEVPSYNYLVEPINEVIHNLDNNISFSSYIVTNNTISTLRAKKREVQQQLAEMKERYTPYSLEEKEASFSILQDLLKSKMVSNMVELKEKQKQASRLRDEIRELQNSDDQSKLHRISTAITELYMSATSAEFVQKDAAMPGFKITYIKKGNILQPQIYDTLDNSEDVNYYVGSLARQTLIQLSGYLAFTEMLTQQGQYPIIPFLVIDHPSKPFDRMNQKAIGDVLKKYYRANSKADFQIFLFDSETPENLNIQADKYQNLVEADKTGFNPFFRPVSS